MPDPPPLVDIHCHLLPGLDDGAADWGETLDMARLAVADGISTVVATPHQLGSYGENHGRDICSYTAKLQLLLRQQDIPLEVLPGADVRIEPDMVYKLRSGEVLTLADRHRHVLLELPHEVYLPLDGLLATLRAAGMVAVLSHPERNRGILRRPNVSAQLVEAGCLLQVTAGSLVGTFGPQVMKFARWLVAQQLVHFVGSDAHGARVRRPLLRRAFDCVASFAGYETAVDLCCRNPALVVAGRAVAPRRQRPPKSRMAGWFRWKTAS